MNLHNDKELSDLLDLNAVRAHISPLLQCRTIAHRWQEKTHFYRFLQVKNRARFPNSAVNSSSSSQLPPPVHCLRVDRRSFARSIVHSHCRWSVPRLRIRAGRTVRCLQPIPKPFMQRMEAAQTKVRDTTRWSLSFGRRNGMYRLDYWTNCAPSTNYDDRVRRHRWIDRCDTSSLDRSTRGTTAIVIFSIHS